MKIKRKEEMSQLEKAIIGMIFRDVGNIPDDGIWRKYEKKFIYEQQDYIVKCSFKLDNHFLTYRNLYITKEAKTIFLGNA